MAAYAIAAAPRREAGWLYSRTWDLSLIIFSAVLVPVPFLIAWMAHATGWMTENQAIDAINILVAGLIGGPHLFSTITYTFLDKNFRERHSVYANLAFLLPAGVVYMGMYHYRLLVSFFFTWASLHVLHQVMYLSDCYRERAAHRDAKWSQYIDYGLILTGLYPVGIYKIAQGNFRVGGVALPYPDFLKALPLAQMAGVVFGALLIAWIVKTVREFQQGRGSLPKTLLIGITTVVSFCLPLGSNLDVLFQGYNTWHSFQYLFLLWLVNRLRDQRGELPDGFVRRLVRRKGMGAYYLCFLAATGILVIATLIVRQISSMPADQSYFVVVLSVLLMHYYFDHFLFTQPQMVD